MRCVPSALFVEARMIEIEDTLRYAKVVDDDVPSDVVRVGPTCNGDGSRV